MKKEYLISHLSDWKRFFIDNLNGFDINIRYLLNKNTSNIDLFNNEDLIKLNDEFSKDFFNAFKYIKYNFKIKFISIKYDKYIKNINDLFKRNEEIRNIFDISILNKIKHIKKEKIIKNIYKNYNFDENDQDFISIIIKYMKQIYNNILIKTLIQFENNNIISTILLNESDEEMKTDYFKNIYNSFIYNFDTSFENFSVFSTEKQEINLYLGLSYP
eukprot:jgi/Orpsp1_1/1175517/evm.model.c7180000054188.1